jgi:hypothetical protein
MRYERLDRLVESLHGAERATPDQLPGDDTNGKLVRQPHFVTFAAFPLVKAVYLLKS